MSKTEQFVDVEDKRYPQVLKEVLKNLEPSLGPKKLYYKGNWSEEIFKNCLAVVGSRHLTSYGRKATQELVTRVASAGVTIVSGFMYGGDEAAHSSAVKAGGKTIAVMPSGINRIHPESQKELYQAILDSGGLIISEYEDMTQPQNFTYVQRNRIVAGLSKAILVTEAALESGTLITASYAKKFGKKVFALPGQITSEVSKGSLQLIKEGAEVVMEAKDILDYFNMSPGQQILPSSAKASAGLEQKIIDQLKREPMKADDMARMLGLPISKIGTVLSLMQLKGMINSDSSKYYLS